LLYIYSAEDIKNNSVSAGDIVEFLKEFSKDLTSEVTTEIREAANAVDEFIATPENAGAIKDSVDKKNTKLYNC
jgi:negative regulator of replication initiation